MQPGIDYTEVPPISSAVTLQFVNNFVVNTTQFLNKFAWAADTKLSKVTSTMRRLEITLSLLEAKLNSIEGINDGAPAAPAADANGAPPAPPPPGAAPAAGSDIPAPPPLAGASGTPSRPLKKK
jgi:WASH complex subunit CCDC53